MEDYFEKTISQYKTRISQALDCVKNELSSEQSILAAKCKSVLDDSYQKLDSLEKDLSLLQTESNNLIHREFQRILRDINYVENIGIAALERSNEFDAKLNFLVKKIREEIKYPLPLAPSVTATSKEYFYVHTRFNFNLICVPPGERNSFLHLPDLYHELAHPLLTEKNSAKLKPFQDGLEKIKSLALQHFTTEILERGRQRGPDTTVIVELWLTSWYQYWATEFLCDLFAVYTLGPAFVWSHYNLCIKRTENPFEVVNKKTTSHPADDARMTLMLFALDRLGFVEDANKIESRWKEFTDRTKNEREIEFDQCYPRNFLGNIEEIAFQAVERTDLRIVSPETDSYVHKTLNQAWEKFWENQESYDNWEPEEIIRFYNHCIGTENINLNLRKQAIMKTSTRNSSAETQKIFKTSLAELKHNILNTPDFVNEYDFLDSEDIKKLELVFQEPPRGGIYDHNSFERKFYLSSELIDCFGNYWNINDTEETQKKRMCKLFFLHEFIHTPQKVNSNTYPYSKNSKNSFRFIDYKADAFAVKGCLKTESTYLPWNEHLTEILVAHVKGGEVFAEADDGRNSDSMEGGRFHRQAIWHLQYARARAFKAEACFEDFYLEKHISLEVFHILPNGEKENLCLKESVSKDDFQNVLEVHIVWDGVRTIYHLTQKHFINYFIKGIFECDFDAVFEAFRPLFDTHLELVGRSKTHVISNKLNKRSGNFDRVSFIQKLSCLHGDELDLIIASIETASSKVSNNETNSKKVTQLINWAESGLGPGIEKIYDVAKKFYPSHFI